jgi:hypothetical protein
MAVAMKQWRRSGVSWKRGWMEERLVGCIGKFDLIAGGVMGSRLAIADTQSAGARDSQPILVSLSRP